MTPDVEAAALRWLERHLRTHTCKACGGTWITRRSIGVIFHQCEPSVRRRPRVSMPDERREAERVEWARDLLGPIADRVSDHIDKTPDQSAVYNSLEEALGPRAWLDVEGES